MQKQGQVDGKGYYWSHCGGTKGVGITKKGTLREKRRVLRKISGNSEELTDSENVPSSEKDKDFQRALL